MKKQLLIALLSITSASIAAKLAPQHVEELGRYKAEIRAKYDEIKRLQKEIEEIETRRAKAGHKKDDTSQAEINAKHEHLTKLEHEIATLEKNHATRAAAAHTHAADAEDKNAAAQRLARK